MILRIIISLVMLMSFPQLIWAITGKEIVEKNNALKRPVTAKIEMQMLIYKGTRLDEKKLTIFSKESGDGEDKTLLSFQRPTRIKLLTHTHKKREDDQWLVLSSGRVKRIISSDKGKSFVHSHFYYDDLGSRDLDDYTHNYIGDEKVRNFDCYKVESKEIGEKEKVYDKIILYARKSDCYILQIDFFQKGKLHKTLVNHDIKLINDILTPMRTVMSQADGSGRTELKIEQVEYDIVIKNSKFNKEALR